MSLTTLTSANIVVLASSFNASIATPKWLLKHVIDEQPTDYMITPVVSLFKTDSIEILIEQSRMQVACGQICDSLLDQCSQIVNNYVQELPHTPYTAVGLNYIFEVRDNTDGLQKRLSTALGDLGSIFADYSVGPRIIGILDGHRVSIMVEPSLEQDEPMRVRVNYHYDCANEEMVRQKANLLRPMAISSTDLVQAVLFKGED